MALQKKLKAIKRFMTILYLASSSGINGSCMDLSRLGISDVRVLWKAFSQKPDHKNMCKYSTNHPQLKWHTCVQKQNHVWHQTTHVHACKLNPPHTRTYPYEVSATK